MQKSKYREYHIITDFEHSAQVTTVDVPLSDGPTLTYDIAKKKDK